MQKISSTSTIIATAIATTLILLGCFSSSRSHGLASEPEVAGRTLAQWSELTRDTNRVVRLRAIKTLGSFGPLAKTALSEALENQDAAVRYTAAVHIGRLAPGELDKPTIETLRGLFADDSQPAVQMAVAFALCKTGPNEEYLGLLIERLDYPERGMSCSAAELLGMLGKDAATAVPALEKCFNQHGKNSEGDYHRGKAAQNALRKIVPGWEKE